MFFGKTNCATICVTICVISAIRYCLHLSAVCQKSNSLMRPIGFRRVPPSQTISDDVDYSADYARVIDTRSSVGAWEIRFDALNLGPGEPIAIRHKQILLPI